MTALQETNGLRWFLPRYNIYLLLWGVVFYGLGIATPWWLAGHRSPKHYEARVNGLQQIISLQNDYIQVMHGKRGAQDLRRLTLRLLIERKQLDGIESQMGIQSETRTSRQFSDKRGASSGN